MNSIKILINKFAKIICLFCMDSFYSLFLFVKILIEEKFDTARSRCRANNMKEKKLDQEKLIYSR